MRFSAMNFLLLKKFVQRFITLGLLRPATTLRAKKVKIAKIQLVIKQAAELIIESVAELAIKLKIEQVIELKPKLRTELKAKPTKELRVELVG